MIAWTLPSTLVNVLDIAPAPDLTTVRLFRIRRNLESVIHEQRAKGQEDERLVRSLNAVQDCIDDQPVTRGLPRARGR